MYASLNVHTEDTIAAGEQALLTFEQAMKVPSHILNLSSFLSDF